MIAVAALLAGVAIVAVVLVLIGGSGGGDGAAGGSPRPGPAKTASGSPDSPVKLPSIAKVRNAHPQPGWERFAGPVPILRYDQVGTPEPGESFPELFVPPADFRAQMDWLESHGYEAVGLETVQAAWAGGTLPAKPIVLSFDGVEGDLSSVVVPELRRRGWPGVLVLDPEASPPPAAVVARLVALGWDLEPSGRDPAAALRYVKAHFPAPARNFAFPPAGSSQPISSAVKEAGFSGATVATGGGFAEPSRPFAMPRITIFGLSRITGFVEALRSRGGGVGA